MLELTTESVARMLGAPLTGGAGPVTGVSTDSRTTKPGDCFFAIAGENFDGHQYLAQAFAQGAACAVVNSAAQGLDTVDGPLLKVPDTIEALGDLARVHRRMHSFQVVAITGSVGKTTTRQIVYHVLNRHFAAHQAKKNFNNAIGLPLTLLEADPDDEVIVAELGANQPGEIAYLTRIAQPDIAVVTNVHPAHLAGFGDLNTIIREKTAIAEGLGTDGVFIVNGDIGALLEACRAGDRAFKTFGRSADCNYRPEQIIQNGLTSSFHIAGRRVNLPLPGPGNIDNAVAAWAVCESFGLEASDFAKAIESLPRVAMRAEPLQIGTFTVLNDCYNANPASMNNALAILSNLRQDSSCVVRDASCDKEGMDSCLRRNDNTRYAIRDTHNARRGQRSVFICGAMAELGDQSESLHAELGQAVAAAGVDLLITVGEATKATANAAQRANPNQLQSAHFDNTISLCDSLQQLLREYDIILVKGSRTAQLENVIERLSRDYG